VQILNLYLLIYFNYSFKKYGSFLFFCASLNSIGLEYKLLDFVLKEQN